MPQPFKPVARFPADSRKQQIVETVLELVAARGTEAVSVQLVADAIGVTQPAVFRHFPTKEAMWLAEVQWPDHPPVSRCSQPDATGQPRPGGRRHMLPHHGKIIERYRA